MPRIDYNARNFSTQYGTNLSGQNTLVISWAELIWAAISVGRAELFHIIRHGRYSIFEISYRTSILFANLCEDCNGHLIRSSAYVGLDPSEKSAISYFLGLTMTKVFCARILTIPWLMHLDVYREILQPELRNTRSRPDLIGKNNQGEWVVLESKGRTNGFDRRALQRAKEQAQQVQTISGEIPTLRIGLQVHFERGILHLEVDDPNPKKGQEFEIPIPNEKFFDGYYRPFRKWLSDGETASFFNTQYRQSRISSTDISVGLADFLFEGHDDFPNWKSDSLVSEDGNTFAARDGLLVTTGPLWSRKNMLLEPQERV